MGILDTLKDLNDRHERLKNYVHTRFRYPLPKYGQYFMGFVYFTIPVIGGLAVMNWAISKAHDSIGEHGEKLRIKDVQGVGDKYVDSSTGQYQKVGAGGWGAGVKLATSDEETQKRNNEKLQKFLKHQQKMIRANKRREETQE